MRNLIIIVPLLASSTAYCSTISSGVQYKETYRIPWSDIPAASVTRPRLAVIPKHGTLPTVSSSTCWSADGPASIDLNSPTPGYYYLNLPHYGPYSYGACNLELTFTEGELINNGDIRIIDGDDTVFGDKKYDHKMYVCTATVPDSITFPASTAGTHVSAILHTSGLTEKNYITYTSSSMDSDGVLALTNEATGQIYVKLTETDAIDHGKWVTSPQRPDLHLNLTSSETSPAGEYTGTITATINCE